MTGEPVIDIAHELNALGVRLKDARRYDAAIIAFRRVIATRPNDASLWSNLGSALWNIGAYDEARQALRHALDLDPHHVKAYGNRGLLLGSLGYFDQADQALTRAIELDGTGDPSLVFNRATVRLSAGDWLAGLADYESRIEHRGVSAFPKMPYPLWKGEDLSGKTLFIQGEQGIGDRILLSRYLFWLVGTYPTARLLCCINNALVPLLWDFRHIVTFVHENVPWPEDVDYGLFLGSLPFFRGTTPDSIPPDPGFIRARALKQRALSPANLPAPNVPALKVGICWTGNPEQLCNAERSIPLEQLARLAEDPGIILYGLQVGSGRSDIERLGLGDLVCDLGGDLAKHGLMGTALAMLELDVVVTVCTSVAHLAGALGIDCITLLCDDPYWIWLRDTDRTAWYPSMTLLRQKHRGEWMPLVDETRRLLAERAHTAQRVAA